MKVNGREEIPGIDIIGPAADCIMPGGGTGAADAAEATAPADEDEDALRARY